MTAKRLTLLALYLTIALILAIFEAQLPPPVPINGIKLGLANIVILSALYTFSKKEAFLILILRVIIVSFFAGQPMSFLYSLVGGMLSFIVMCLCTKLLKPEQMWVTSVFGAVFHNFGQIVVAIIVTATPQIAYYMIILTASGIITGIFTGICAGLLLKRIKKIRA